MDSFAAIVPILVARALFFFCITIAGVIATPHIISVLKSFRGPVPPVTSITMSLVHCLQSAIVLLFLLRLFLPFDVPSFCCVSTSAIRTCASHGR